MIIETNQKPILFLASEHPALNFAELLEGAQFVVAGTVYAVVRAANKYKDIDRLEAIVVGSISQDDPFSMRVVYLDSHDEKREYFFKLISVGDALAAAAAGFSQSKRSGNLTIALMSVPQSIDELYRVLSAMTREHFGGWIVKTYEQAQRVDFSEWEIKLYASEEMRSRYGQIYCLCSVTYEAYHKPVSSIVSKLDENQGFLIEPLAETSNISPYGEYSEIRDLSEAGELIFIQSEPRLFMCDAVKKEYFETQLVNTARRLNLDKDVMWKIQINVDKLLPPNCFEFRDERDKTLYRAYVAY